MDIEEEFQRFATNKRNLSIQIIEISSQQQVDDPVEIVQQRSDENQKNLIHFLSQNNFSKGNLQEKNTQKKESKSQDSEIQIINFSRKFGLITFNDQATNRQINLQMRTSFFLEMAGLKRWVYSKFKKLNDRNWIESLAHIKIIQILHFQGKIYFTSQLLTLDPFYHIKFTKLTVLDLSRNKLKNIQQLQFMNVPSLRTLNLRNNFITNVKFLNKLNHYNIKNIDLDENYIRQIQYGKIKLNKYYMRKFQARQKIKRGQWIREKCGRDLSKFIKCEARYFTTIAIQPGICQRDNRQPKIKQQLQNRYVQDKVFPARILF